LLYVLTVGEVNMPDLVYLDNSASTRLDERVLEAMKPYLFDTYAVATSEFGYSIGIEAREGLEKARAEIGGRIGAEPEEIVFTSGSTESSNLAIKGVASAMADKQGKHLITSRIEDFPVLNSMKALSKQGFDVTLLDVDGDGMVDPEQVAAALTDRTVLVSVQHANQEIGTLQHIDEIARICKQNGVAFHTDATHTFCRVPLDVKEIPVDLATIAAHTIHGPRGIGALYIRKDTSISKIMDGGFQESNLRPGLENIPGAVGFASAVGLVTDEETENLRAMRDRIIDRLLDEVPKTTLNGHRTQRTPQNANITFHLVEGESITLHLDMRGFAVSTGSACFSRSLEASHVITGIGGDHERAHGSVRFTFGRYNKMEDVDSMVAAVSEVVEQLRKISPLGRDKQ
jgi:cysteine desulfurase